LLSPSTPRWSWSWSWIVLDGRARVSNFTADFHV
jgi:hypothetical protein